MYFISSISTGIGPIVDQDQLSINLIKRFIWLPFVYFSINITQTICFDVKADKNTNIGVFRNKKILCFSNVYIKCMISLGGTISASAFTLGLMKT